MWIPGPVGLRTNIKESIRPLEDSTIPKDTDIQDDELNENQPGEGNEDTPTGGIHKPEQPPSQGIGDETHTPREFKSANQGYSIMRECIPFREHIYRQT
jgi:hypothetical protein